jgi:hypothetical protein
MTKRLAILCCLTGVFFFHLPATIFAQTNSWTNSASGNWEDSYWSLGVLPGTNQTIFITNSGIKVVTIGPGTAEGAPGSLSMDSLTISSPSNSANILLLNDAGFDTPLTARQLWVSSSSIVLLYSSSLQISDLAAIEGELIQDEGSQVSNNYTPVVGVYRLNSGTFTGAILRVYGNGRFIQSGGTNCSADLGILTTVGAPEYNLNGGEFDGAITIGFAGTFRQNGGIANVTGTNRLQFEPDAAFVQSGGIFNGPTNSSVKIPTDLESGPTNAFALQTGGTNHEYQLILGAQMTGETDCTFGCYRPDFGGSYTLSNGLLTTFGTTVTANGNFQQFGGIHSISGSLNVGGSIGYVAGGGPAYTGPLGPDYISRATYFLNDGLLRADDIGIAPAGSLVQSGGVASAISGLTLGGPSMSESGRRYSGSYTLQSGTISAPNIWMLDGSQFAEAEGSLVASNLTISAATFTQDRGSNGISGLTIHSLTVSNWSNEYWEYEVTTYTGSYQLGGGFLTVSNLAIVALGQFSQSGGQLIVSNMQLSNGVFSQTNGNIIQSGLLTLDGSSWHSAPGSQQLGHLQLGQSNSILYLPTNSCTLQIRDSSSLAWVSNSLLKIENWSGSLYGGGNQQVIFGSNSIALTSQQLSQIQFQNPAGLPPGNYPARILATGEIVPDTAAPLPPKISINCGPTNGAMQLTIGGDIGRSYDIEVSTDLVNWIWWTNEFNSSGTISIFDWATNSPQRFYRANLGP